MYNNLKCKFCGSNRINKIGKQKQRYLCRKARSWTDASLLAIGSLSVSEVPKRLKGARSMRWVYELNEYQTCLIECVNNRIRHYLARFRRKRTLGVRK